MMRARAGTAYRDVYRTLPLPRSVGALPRLPDAPVSRRFGADRGRPIDRVYIEGFLERHRADVGGAVLEVAEDTYTRRFGGEKVTRSDVLDVLPGAPAATITGDLGTGEGLPSGAFDCCVCTQVLGAVGDPGAAIAHAHAALRPRGVLLASVPGISQAHQGDPVPDRWRFTTTGVRELFARHFDGDADVEGHGTVRAAAAFLYGLAEHELEPGALEPHDPEYALVITVRAVRAG